MKLLSGIFAMLCASFILLDGAWGAETNIKKGLIVIINQKYLSLDEAVIPMLPTLIDSIDTKNMGVLGEIIANFKAKILSQQLASKEGLIKAWDDARAEWITIAANNSRKYDHIYMVTGAENYDNDAYMNGIFTRARTKNDLYDYVTIVHGGDQTIKAAWGVPEGDNKLRMVYNSGCGCGSGKNEFIINQHAAIAAGHVGAHSASPFFSQEFLQNWFNGQSFVESLNAASEAGKKSLQSSGVSTLVAMIIGKSLGAEEILDQSKMQFAANPGIKVNTFNIDNDQLGKTITFKTKKVVEIDIK